MKKNIILLSLVVISVFVNSCGDLFFDCYEGNGKLGTEMRSVSSFNSIVSNGTFDLQIQGDAQQQSVRIEGDENLLERIVIRVRDKVLYIELEEDECISPELGMTIFIGTDQLKRVQMDGTGNITLNDLSETNLETEINGTGNITLHNVIVSNKYSVSIDGTGNLYADGKCTYVDYIVNGTANIYAENYKSSFCTVRIDGTCQAYVHAYEKLFVDIDGVGSIYLTGTVSDDNITTNIDGVGTVTRI